MFIKIYFGDKPVILCDVLDNTVKEYMNGPGTIYSDDTSVKSIKSFLDEIEKPQFLLGILFNEDFQKLKESFFAQFTFLQTGGGLILNSKQEVLMILRRGKWDLPKGKLEEGETLEKCALREVEEETGLINLEIEKQITVTYHTYQESGKHILKESHWYKMKYNSDKNPIPQTEEYITEIKWVDQSGIKKYTANTFATIVEVLSFAGN